MDYISDAFIKTTRCTGDQLVTSGGTRYKALIVPAARLMPAATLRKLVELARQGATVIFVEQYPEDVPGYHELDKNRKTFQHITRQLPATDSFKQTQQFAFGKGQIIVGSDYQQALAQTGIPAEELKTRYGLQFIRRSNPEGHHYFVSCLQDKDTDGWVTLNVPETTAMFFNPMNGERGRAQSRTSNGKLEVRLQLKSGESLIIQTLNKPLDYEPACNYPEEQAYSLSLDHGRKLNFVESTPSKTGRFDIDSPLSWTELEQPEAKINMGTGCYSLEIDLPALAADDWILDLGDVRERARVRINGPDAGTAWAAPFRLKVGMWLKTGKNLIEVEVTDLPANRIADMDRKNIEWRIFKDINMAKLNYVKGDYKNWSTMPSGLNGNVRLIPVKYSKQ